MRRALIEAIEDIAFDLSDLESVEDYFPEPVFSLFASIGDEDLSNLVSPYSVFRISAPPVEELTWLVALKMAAPEFELKKHLLYRQGELHPHETVGGSNFFVVSASKKQVKIRSQTPLLSGKKFSGKTYTFRWDGKGYVRQKRYLAKTEEGFM